MISSAFGFRWIITFALLCGLAMSTAGAEPAGKAANSTNQTLRAEDIYRRISQAKASVTQKKWAEAEKLLRELEAQTMRLHARTQLYRAQAYAAVAQKDYQAANAAYQKLFDLLLKPQSPPEELATISSVVLWVFQTEYRSMLIMAKLPLPSPEFRAKLLAMAEGLGDASGKPPEDFQKATAGEHLEIARSLIKSGRRAEGLAAYERLFLKHPDFLMVDGTIVNVRFEWIQAHDFSRNSPERIALLEKLYRDPVFKANPGVANIGVHLGGAYLTSRHPGEEAHWKALVEQIEAFQTSGRVDPAIREMLRDNHQSALMSYASCLDRREANVALREVVAKLESTFPDDRGGMMARRLREKLEKGSR